MTRRITKSSQVRRPAKRRTTKGKGGDRSTRRRTTRKDKRTTLQKKCDALFSKLVRLRDRVCVRCGSAEFLQCSHHLSRRFLIIRFDFDNAVAHCRSCHTLFTRNPDEHTLWIINRIGMEKFMQLHELRLQGTRERYRPDYHAILADLKEKLEQMEVVA